MKAIPLAVAAILVVPSLFAAGASGGFHFRSMNIEFNARAADATSPASGLMNFSAPVEISSGDGESTGVTSTARLTLKADFDCVAVSGNNAVMSGIVRAASVKGYNGQRIILAVQDGGEGSKAPADKFSWGVYGDHAITWFPTDAELENDGGWKLSWIATDAERDDDKGIEINHRDQPVDCHSFALAAYTLDELPQGSGNIQVRP